MTDLTKSQEKAIEQICDLFPGDEGRVVGVVEDGSVDFEIRGAVYRVSRRGKFVELRAEASNVAPAPESDGAAQPSVEDPSLQISPKGSGVTGTNPPVSEPSHTAAGREPSGGDGGAAGVSGGSPEISDEGAGASDGPGGAEPVESPDRQSGPGASGGSSSGPESSAQAEAEQVDPGAPSSLPSPGVPVPMVDSLPQVQRPAVFEAMTLADEQQVAAELEGRALKSMVYGFRQGGSYVYGLSWLGVREAVRQMNARTSAQIGIDNSRPPMFEDVTLLAEVGWDADANEPVMEEVPAIRVTVSSVDAVHGTVLWGTATVARDTRSKQKKDAAGRYRIIPDGFAAAKALSKAQRNALEGHLPRVLVEEVIAQFRGTEQVEFIEGKVSPAQLERPPALTDDRAKASGDRARELFAELKRLVGTKVITPGRFHQLFTAVQHDHDRLDEFVAYMEEQVAKARGEDG